MAIPGLREGASMDCKEGGNDMCMFCGRDHDVLRWLIETEVSEVVRNNDIDMAGLFGDALGIRMFGLTTLTRRERDDFFDENLDAIDRIDVEGNISKTFPAGDLIARASCRRGGDTVFYMAVEAAYRIGADDVIRASDHAKMLREVTGYAAFAVVAGFEVNPGIGDEYRRRIVFDLTEYMKSGRDDVVFWYQLVDGA